MCERTIVCSARPKHNISSIPCLLTSDDSVSLKSASCKMVPWPRNSPWSESERERESRIGRHLSKVFGVS
jgi:hypothetical protein